MLEGILDPILSPLLKLPSFWAILIITFGIALLITLVYKWMTDQHLMRSLKEEMKKFQDEIKALRHDPQKAMEVQKRAMETNMKYMMHSMKPTLITFIPIIIIFGWLNANIAFEPIMPGEQFTTMAVFEPGTEGTINLNAPEGIQIISDSEQDIKCYTEDGWIFDNEICKADWELKGDAGNYLIEYEYEDKAYKKELLITEEKGYAKISEPVKGSKLKLLENGNEKVRPIPGIGLGWLGTYIIFSMVFSMSLRKILKLH